MFDVGYSELLLIGVIALVVLGPEKLPGALRTTGLWIGRIRRSYDRIKVELEQEVGMDELRRQIHNDGILEDARRFKREFNDTIQSTHDVLRTAQDGFLPPDATPEERAAHGMPPAPVNAPPQSDASAAVVPAAPHAAGDQR